MKLTRSLAEPRYLFNRTLELARSLDRPRYLFSEPVELARSLDRPRYCVAALQGWPNGVWRQFARETALLS